jgi:hypothetical protein
MSASTRLGQGHVFALELGLQVAALLLHLAELLVARGELAFELLLGPLRGRGLAEHALGVHEADLHLDGCRREDPSCEERRCHCLHVTPLGGVERRRTSSARTPFPLSLACHPAWWR